MARNAQARLPFGASEGARDEKIATLKGLAERVGLSLRERELLIRIALVEFDNGNPLRKTYAQLGEHSRGLGCSESTAFRTVKRLQSLELIQVEAVKTGHGQRPNEYRVDWAVVLRMLGINAEPGCHFAEAGLSKRRSQVVKMSKPGCQNDNHIRNTSLNTSPNTLPSTSSSDSTTTTTAVLDEAKIDEAAAIAARAGVSVCNAREFATRAIARGDDVGALFSAWSPLAATWEPQHAAAIFAVRLRDGIKGLKPTEGWPAPTFPEKLPKPVKAPKTPPNEPEAESARESTARLEAKHGAKLDAMGLEERVALVGGENSFLAATVRRGGGRGFLLERLEARSNGGNEARSGCISPQNKAARHSPADLQNVGPCSDWRGVGGGVA